MTVEQDKLIALAAIFQSSLLVKQLANTGRYEPNSFEVMLNSLLTIDSDSAIEIYQSPDKLKLGFEEIIKMFESNKNKKDNEIARYSLSILHLERKLIRDDEKLGLIKQGIDRAKIQTKHFDLLHENVIANLAGIYTDTLSTYKFRIHVTGDPNYLSNNNNMNKIRALLLSGVRAAVLWRQLGGTRWQLVFGRKHLVQLAKQALKAIKAQELEPA